mgnify:CR=1 FL=1
MQRRCKYIYVINLIFKSGFRYGKIKAVIRGSSVNSAKEKIEKWL